jgi:hypothetical protein
METFIIKLAVAVIPLVVLVASVIIISGFSMLYKPHPLSWHRKRHSIQRTLASGVMLR